jgi:hypothetical protein
MNYFTEMLKLAISQRRLENAAAIESYGPLASHARVALYGMTGTSALRPTTVTSITRGQVDTYKSALAASGDEISSLALKQARRFARIASDATGERIEPPSEDDIKKLLGGLRINGLTLRQNISNQSALLADRIKQSIRSVRDAKGSRNDLKDKLTTHAFGTATAQMSALVRTASATMTASAIFEIASRYPDAFAAGYTLDVTLDGRTSKICMGWAARRQVFPFKASSPRPPFHWNCRTILMPVIAGQELPEDGEAWLRAQPAETQDTILGRPLAERFRAGDVGLHSLVDSDHSIQTRARAAD